MGYRKRSAAFKAQNPQIYKKKAPTKVLSKVVKDVRHLKKLENINKGVLYGPNFTYSALVIGGNITYLNSNLASIINTYNANNLRCMYKSYEITLNYEYRTIAGGAVATPYGVLTAGYLRCILLEDMANTNANPTILAATALSESVLVESNSASSMNYTAMRNENNKKRFRIIHDKTYEWRTIDQAKRIKIKKTWKNKVVEYDNAGGTVADASIGQLFLIQIPSDSLIAFTSGGTVGLGFLYNEKLMFEHA